MEIQNKSDVPVRVFEQSFLRRAEQSHRKNFPLSSRRPHPGTLMSNSVTNAGDELFHSGLFVSSTSAAAGMYSFICFFQKFLPARLVIIAFFHAPS